MEHRICPSCERWLRFRNGKYLCSSCWVLYTLEETKPHPNPEGLCYMVEKKAEAGVWAICSKCGKSEFYGLEEWTKQEAFLEKIFNPEYVTSKKEEWDKILLKIEKDCKALEDKEFVMAQLRKLTNKELEEVTCGKGS